MLEKTYLYSVICILCFDNQYGFKQKHSTDYASLELVDRIITQIDKHDVPFSIFIDPLKAFDTIDHSILFNKLRYYGLDGSTLNLFKSYLSNRSQYVEFENAKSDILSINIGVPQGSILGPLLFINIGVPQGSVLGPLLSINIGVPQGSVLCPLLSINIGVPQGSVVGPLLSINIGVPQGSVLGPLLSINIGVPQGSILCPLLFIIHINDFPKASKMFDFIITTPLYLAPSNPLTTIYKTKELNLQ